MQQWACRAVCQEAQRDNLGRWRGRIDRPPTARQSQRQDDNGPFRAFRNEQQSRSWAILRIWYCVWYERARAMMLAGSQIR